jgi:hypothetical protein
VATLSLSGGRELQWAVYPLNQDGPVQILHGTVGDVPVTERALRTTEFMTGW